MDQEGVKQLKVLLVEDHVLHANLICDHLNKAAGYRFCVERASRLSEAIERLGRGGIDVVLLDLGLPDSQIEETLPRILETGVDVPVIILTLLNDLEIAIKAIQQGAQDYLLKSDLNGELLIRVIRSAIERKNMQREIQSYVAKLEQSNARLKDFGHILAHEIKSPLTAVQAALNIVNDKYHAQFDDETADFLKVATSAIWNMSELVDRLFDFVSIGLRNSEFSDVDIEVVFYQVYALLKPAIKDANASITHDPLPTVRGNEIQIRQLFKNLISNALKYCVTESPRIHVAAEENDKNWIISVSDNGPGVPAEHRERIFDMFVRLENVAEIPGTGIGLSFCKLIVENHGGNIWVESAPGQGSVFHFTLPKQNVASISRSESHDMHRHKILDALPR
jgi:two-component system, sensor histidine kinase and response regulator